MKLVDQPLEIVRREIQVAIQFRDEVKVHVLHQAVPRFKGSNDGGAWFPARFASQRQHRDPIESSRVLIHDGRGAVPRSVIVDDGSRDRTPSIVDKYSRRFDWITVLTLARESGRDPGSAIIRAFEAGYRLVQDMDFDFVVKLDCDLDFAPDYFQRLIGKFHRDPALGIASGTYLEKRKGRWLKVPMPAYHAAGASKV